MAESTAAERPNIPQNTNFGVASCEVKFEAQNRQTDLLDCIALPFELHDGFLQPAYT